MSKIKSDGQELQSSRIYGQEWGIKLCQQGKEKKKIEKEKRYRGKDMKP